MVNLTLVKKFRNLYLHIFGPI